jgi:hypothetical protein
MSTVKRREVEIYSDATNRAVIRHPSRKYPGVLVQGDDLHRLCQLADAVCDGVGRHHSTFHDANQLRNALWSDLDHYKTVLVEHGIPIPFNG